MVRKIEVGTFDDLTGEAAGSTVRFGYDGRWFEIDLTDANAAEMTALLTLWSERGRVLSGGVGSSRSAVDRARAAAIRAWGKTHGLTVADRGRISDEVVDAYERSVPQRRRLNEFTDTPGSGDPAED